MTFLTRTPGMTLREARELVELHELVEHSLVHGPVPLSIYAAVRRVHTDIVEHQERNARRFVKRLKAIGFLVLADGDAEKLVLDFSDRRLAVEVTTLITEATQTLARSSVYDSGHETEETDDEPGADLAPLEQLASDHKLGLTIRRLMRRYKIRQDRARVLLAAKGCKPHRAGRLRIEEQRSAEVIRRALEARGEGANLRSVAEILGCSPETARAFLRRVKKTPRGEGSPPFKLESLEITTSLGNVQGEAQPQKSTTHEKSTTKKRGVGGV